MAKGKEVEQPRTGTSVAGVHDYGEMGGAGFEDVKSTDLAIPFLTLLQTNSPAVEEEKGKPGQYLNSVTGDIYDSIPFQPVLLQEVWVEWVPRTRGGGIIELHAPDSELIRAILEENNGQRIPPKGADGRRQPFMNGDNEVVETHYIYGNILNDEGTDIDGFGLLSFSSTKIKPYRGFVTAMRLMKGSPPIFAFRAKIGAAKQKNESGTFFNYDIRPLGADWSISLIDPSEQRHLLDAGIELRKMIQSGQAKADTASQQSETAPTGDGDIPF